jgi:hypothetical protein
MTQNDSIIGSGRMLEEIKKDADAKIASGQLWPEFRQMYIQREADAVCAMLCGHPPATPTVENSPELLQAIGVTICKYLAEKIKRQNEGAILL